MLENRELKVFLEVASTLNMTKAARHLHIAEPSVSRIIKSLEEQLGYKLFKRGTRALTLTKSGELLQERSQVILNLVQDLEHEFNALESNISGKINIGLAETPAFRLIAPLLVNLRQRYPQVIFGIESGNAEQVCAKLDQGLYDFGVVVSSFPNAEQYRLVTLPQPDIWGVIIPRDHHLAQKEAVTPFDLKDEPLLFSRQEQLASVRPQTKHLATKNSLNPDSQNTHENEETIQGSIEPSGNQSALSSEQTLEVLSVSLVENVLLRDVIAQNAKPQKTFNQNEPSPQEQWLSDSPLKTWFGAYWKQLNIVTTFNLIYNAALLVEAKMGLALSLDGIIDLTNHPTLCFKPLSPQVSAQVSIIWPRFRSFTPAARLLREEFLNTWDKPQA